MTICKREIRDPSAWVAADVVNDSSWIIQFEDSELAELDAARRKVAEMGFTWGGFGRGDFPLPTLGKKLSHAADMIRNGRGFVLMRGIPVDRYSLDDLKVLYWGIGLQFGRPMGQNRLGQLITHVEDYSEVPQQKLGGRGYRGTGELNPHTDHTDMVGLLCVREAKEGGDSAIASSVTIHNHLLQHDSGCLPALYEGMHTTLRNEGPLRAFDEPSPYPLKVFEYYNGKLSCFYARGRLLGGQDATGRPFTTEQLHAIDSFFETSKRPEYTLKMRLQPGDIQFLHNHTIVHSRTAYADYEDPKKKRLLLRLWVRFDEEDYRVSPFRSRLLRWGQDAIQATLV